MKNIARITVLAVLFFALCGAGLYWFSKGAIRSTNDQAGFTPQISNKVKWIPFAQVDNQEFGFAEMNTHIYLSDKTTPGSADSVFPDSNPSSFLVSFNSNGKPTLYAKDDQHVYFFDLVGDSGVFIRMLPKADPNTFQPLDAVYDVDTFYSKDRVHVYWMGHLVEGADSGTFGLVSHASYDAQDQNHHYSAGHTVQ